MGRTNIEQRLKRDINDKNVIARDLRALLRQMARYRVEAAATGNRRWQKRYPRTVERLGARAKELADEVLRRGADLERRMHEELKISETEVQEFRQRLEKELAEHKAAQQKANLALEEWQIGQISWKDASKEQRDKLRALEDAAGKARAQEARERKEADKAAREVASEARDKALFALELDRIAAERQALAPQRGPK